MKTTSFKTPPPPTPMFSILNVALSNEDHPFLDPQVFSLTILNVALSNEEYRPPFKTPGVALICKPPSSPLPYPRPTPSPLHPTPTNPLRF